eukprot:3912114-Rhodomonas_salina.1
MSFTVARLAWRWEDRSSKHEAALMSISSAVVHVARRVRKSSVMYTPGFRPPTAARLASHIANGAARIGSSASSVLYSDA